MSDNNEGIQMNGIIEPKNLPVDANCIGLASLILTPTIASAWLQAYKYPRQRELKPENLVSLTSAMLEGRFNPGTCITFARHKNKTYLIDGQHRLWCIAKSGKSVLCVVEVIEAESLNNIHHWYANMDKHQRRNISDTLRALGTYDRIGTTFDQARFLASGVSNIVGGFKRGNIYSIGRYVSLKEIPPDLLDRYMVDFGDSIRLFYVCTGSDTDPGKNKIKYLIRKGPVSGIALLTFRYSQDRASEFWSGVVNETNLEVGDPRLTLRNTLMNNPTEGGTVSRPWKVGLTKRDFALLVCRAWSSYYFGEKLVSLVDEMWDEEVRVQDTPYDTSKLGYGIGIKP